MAVLWCRDGQLILDGPREERRPFEAADAAFLDEQSAAYTKALTLQTPAGTLLAIGKALHDWLDRKDLLAPIIGESGPVTLDLAVTPKPDARARAFVAAPWELLTDATGAHLAFDATRAYSPARRFGAPGTPWEPTHRDLSVLFMAAAPEGVSDLNYEREEALILDAVERLPVQLAVEESGSLGPLADRLSLEGPFEVLHLTCHGNFVGGHGVLALEDDKGGLDLITADQLCGATGRHMPPLVLVSACRSAEQAGAAVPLALDLMSAGTAQVIGWAGSVYDDDAITFARTLYGALGRRETVPAAAAAARRTLIQELQQKSKVGIGRHWHLARVHLGPIGGGPLCANGKTARRRHLGDKPFLDRKKQVPVAPPAVYVGRRREAQAALRAFSDPYGPAGVLVRGMGRLGKSSLAARIARRRRDLRSAVVFGHYNASAIFSEIVEAVDPRYRASLQTTWRDSIASDPVVLKDAVEAILTGPAAAPDAAVGHQPILLIIDDLESVLETPRPGESCTLVQSEARTPLRSVIEAFAATRAMTESRLLLTSRYTFSLPTSHGDCAGLLLDLQLPPLTQEQCRKLAQAELRPVILASEINDVLEYLSERALAAAAGNPGLQALLTRMILKNPSSAETGIIAVESYRSTGTLPNGEVGNFFNELALTTYHNALTTDELCVMRAARTFRLPVPRLALEIAAAVLGVPAPSAALGRLVGLGYVDIFQNTQTVDLAINALAAPLFEEPTADESRQIARAVLHILAKRWRDGKP
ncbi:CHAT domain-containing protein [Methylobacterium aquaticum]|uniref:CHAT domain-containing protein n=1 Tax=Methylobacterium aquaticum TaxID=270351 RepID=UPI0009E466B7|nr:CHAT domain-containing protein [Methylobacterium aquaticum]